MHLRLTLCAAALAVMTPVVAVVAIEAMQAPSRADADRMEKKFQAIVERSVAPPQLAKPLTTTFTEQELNAYLQLEPEAVGLPSGVKGARVTLLEAGKVDTRALVDLDAVRTSEKRGWLDPLSYVTGIHELRTIGTLRGTKGMGVYTFESASLNGVPVPRTVLQELLAFYTRTPETPKGFVLDQPFELPMGIRELELKRGAATVIQ
jgi:hypothetical protein